MYIYACTSFIKRYSQFFFPPTFTEDPEEGVRIVSRPFSGGDDGEIDADGEVLSEEDTAREIYNDLRGEHTKKNKKKHNTTQPTLQDHIVPGYRILRT